MYIFGLEMRAPTENPDINKVIVLIQILNLDSRSQYGHRCPSVVVQELLWSFSCSSRGAVVPQLKFRIFCGPSVVVQDLLLSFSRCSGTTVVPPERLSEDYVVT